jgi:hypothetical protein
LQKAQRGRAAAKRTLTLKPDRNFLFFGKQFSNCLTKGAQIEPLGGSFAYPRDFGFGGGSAKPARPVPVYTLGAGSS